MSLVQILIANALLLAFTFFLLWVVSVKIRDASIIDMFWGVGFALVAWVSLTCTPDPSTRSLVIAGMVTLWGLRLSAYLTWRNWGKPEDFRYAAMRERRGDRFAIVSLYLVFGLQAALMWIISLPVQLGIATAGDWSVVPTAGVLTFAVGLLFESVGDYQLARFKVDPANTGRVMDRGLWRYTRHPNYFGDFLVWWGIYLASFEIWTWWTLVGPTVISFFLLRVSGVPMLEQSLSTRLIGYHEYLESTSSFFPMPPRPVVTKTETTS